MLISLIILILIGLLLVIVDIIALPGSFIVGIIGGACMVLGIYYAYTDLGSTTGHVFLLGTIFLCALLTYLGLKIKIWEKFMIKRTIEGKVNEIEPGKINVDDEGVTASAIRPIGTVLIKDILVEVESLSGMINANVRVKVIKINGNKIYIAPVI